MSEATQTVYETLGAGSGIRKAVDEFYDRVVADPELAKYFVGIDMGALRRHQAAMLSEATGGPRQYDGREMGAAHAGLHIDDAAFTKVVGHLLATLESLGVDEHTVSTVAQTLGPLRTSIVSA